MGQMKFIALNNEGWGLIYNANMQHINTWIDSLMDPAKSANATGITEVDNLDITPSAPPAITAVAPTFDTISGSGADTELNNNFSAISTFAGQVITDLTALRNTIIADQTLLASIESKINELLEAIREGTGVAILKASS